jgi:carboxypeptidase PM20D1
MNEIRLGLTVVLGVLLASPAQAQSPEQHLAEAITFATISHESKAEFDVAPFLALHAWLEATYPQAHRVLQREKLGAASLLYTWPGSDPSLAPFLLTSHLDVVPVPDPESWTHPPFAGVIADGFVWGRGTLDDKAGVVATFEALELLTGQGFRPRRTLLVALGHDEEVGGEQGAGAITQRLADAGVRVWFSLDEGMAIAEAGATTLTDTPLALIGVAEKGYLTLKLAARGNGGHSSTPPPSTAIGRLARAIVRLEERPLPARTQGVVSDMLRAVAPHTGGIRRLMLAWPGLFGPLIEAQLEQQPSTNAMVRTTTAVTMIDGGIKANVLPREATARVNFRLLPGDESAEVIEHVRRAIDDPEIEIEAETVNEASPVADVKSDAFALLSQVIVESAPDVVVSPALVVGGTDTQHYGKISDNGFRFLPVRFGAKDFERVHGRDERLSVENIRFAVTFFERLVRRAAGEPEGAARIGGARSELRSPGTL